MKKLINIAIISLLGSSAWAADSTIGGLSPITTVPDAYLMPWEYNGIADFHISYSQLTNQILAGMASQGYADASALSRTNGFPWGVLYDASGAGTTAAYNSTNGFPWGILYDASGAAATAALNATNTLATGLKAYADSKTNANLYGWAGVSTNGGTAGINITGSAGTITAFQPLTNNAPALVTGLTNTGLMGGHLIIADANKAETYAVASGAFPVDSDGTATTAGQLTNLIAQTGLPGAVIVGNIPGNAATATTASNVSGGWIYCTGGQTNTSFVLWTNTATGNWMLFTNGILKLGATNSVASITLDPNYAGSASIIVRNVYGTYVGTTYLQNAGGYQAAAIANNSVAAMTFNTPDIFTVAPTFQVTNAAPTGAFVWGTTAPAVWFVVTNTASSPSYIVPGFLKAY